MADEPTIANEAQGIARILIEWDSQNGRLNVAFPNSEIHCRFMMDKARAFLDDEWRKRNAPMIQAPGNGVMSKSVQRRLDLQRGTP